MGETHTHPTGGSCDPVWDARDLPADTGWAEGCLLEAAGTVERSEEPRGEMRVKGMNVGV